MAKPELPIELDALKQTLRAGLDSPLSRSFWWPMLPALRAEDCEGQPVADQDVQGCAERLCALLHEPLLDAKSVVLNPKDKENDVIDQTARKLSAVLIGQGKVAEIDVSYWMPVVKIIVWQVKRIDVCYWMITTLMEQSERYFSPCPAGLHVMFYSFRELLRSFMPKTYTALKTIGALEDKYLSVLFVDFFVEIFPPHILLPLLDAYFLEGVKILYRYALALIAGYKGNIKSGRYSTAKEFWLAVKADGVAVAQAANTSMCNKLLGIDEVMQQADAFLVNERARNQTYFLSGKLKENAYDVGRSIMSKMSKPMNVTRTNIKVLEKAAALVEDKDVVRKSVSRRLSSNGSTSPTTKTLTEKFMESPENKLLGRAKSGTVKNRGSQSPAVSTNAGLPPSPSSSAASNNFTDLTGLSKNIDSLVEQSEVLDASKAFKLLRCLPETVAISGLELCFATYKHGWDISTLYSNTTGLTPCVFVFKLQIPFEEFIVGAVISGAISPPSSVIARGDGKTSRIFKLDNAENPTMFEASDAEGAEGQKLAALTQFCMTTLESISFGASLELGTNALRVESDMKTLFLGPSDTYGNIRPLLENLSGSTDSVDGMRAIGYEIQEVEVYCGATSKRAADSEGRFTEKLSILG